MRCRADSLLPRRHEYQSACQFGHSSSSSKRYTTEWAFIIFRGNHSQVPWITECLFYCARVWWARCHFISKSVRLLVITVIIVVFYGVGHRLIKGHCLHRLDGLRWMIALFELNASQNDDFDLILTRSPASRFHLSSRSFGFSDFPKNFSKNF